MPSILERIQSAMNEGRFILSEKAGNEMAEDGLSNLDIVESILNATVISKTLRSRSPLRKGRTEYLHVIEGPNNDGLVIYTKGRIDHLGHSDVFYVLVSSKRFR